MKNLPISQKQLENQDLDFNIKCALAMAYERNFLEPRSIELTVSDLISEFPNLKDIDFINGIRKGSLGEYGKPYKLSTQEIVSWVREYAKDLKRIDNPDNEEIVTYYDNVNPTRRQITRSKFELMKVRNADGGYIYTEVPQR